MIGRKTPKQILSLIFSFSLIIHFVFILNVYVGTRPENIRYVSPSVITIHFLTLCQIIICKVTCVMVNSYFHYNKYLAKLAIMKNEYYCTTFTDSFFPFILLLIIIYKSKTTIFSIQRKMIFTSLFRELTTVLTKNFKIDIDGISDPLEMCKISFLHKSLSINQLSIFTPCSLEMHYTGITLTPILRQMALKSIPKGRREFFALFPRFYHSDKFHHLRHPLPQNHDC